MVAIIVLLNGTVLGGGGGSKLTAMSMTEKMAPGQRLWQSSRAVAGWVAGESGWGRLERQQTGYLNSCAGYYA
jgi:hypothetical protein